MFLRVLENEVRKARPGAQRKADFEQSFLELRMFNVGEGEAILLVFPGKRAWLIDGGTTAFTNVNNKLGDALVDFVEKRGLTLEAFVPSHPHKDHVGALAKILASGSPGIASSVTIYRSEDTTWNLGTPWLQELRGAIATLASHAQVELVLLRDAHREVVIADGVTAHLFAGSGKGAYTSLFLQLRFHRARLLFTGDAYCPYERELRQFFGPEDFRADVLKVTHHGSSDGTAGRTVEAVRPGIAIASTADESGHTLEKDTLQRLGGRLTPPRQVPAKGHAVWETLVDGDIILRTDGQEYRGGVLFDVAFDAPGHFAQTLDLTTKALEDVVRTAPPVPDSACE